MTISAQDYFSAKLSVETDASDVYAAQQSDERFTLVDVRGDAAWTQGHAVGAVHMPYQEIAARARQELDADLPVVVYCWSPGCNGGAKGAVEFARAGFAVKEMIGGFEYWAREGFPTETADGPLPRMRDPLVSVVESTTRSG